MTQTDRQEQAERLARAGITKIDFSFHGENAGANIKKFEDILVGGAWGRKFVDYEDEYTLLLAGLLSNGGITVYERVYPLKKEYSPETRKRSQNLRDLMNRKYGATNEIADLYPFEPAGRRILHNAPFMAELKAYIRMGDLPPDWIFEMFGHEDCEAIMLFQGFQYTQTEGMHYVFHRVMPYEALTEELQKAQERRNERYFKEIERISANDICSVFPAVPDMSEF